MEAFLYSYTKQACSQDDPQCGAKHHWPCLFIALVFFVLLILFAYDHLPEDDTGHPSLLLVITLKHVCFYSACYPGTLTSNIKVNGCKGNCFHLYLDDLYVFVRVRVCCSKMCELCIEGGGGAVSPHNDIMALTEAGEDAPGFRAKLFSLAQVCPSPGCRSPPGLCERKSKTKTKPDHQQYEAEGGPFGCCLFTSGRL